MLNKIPVLDKGYVARFSSSMSLDEFREVRHKFFRGAIDRRMTDMVYIHLLVRCPLFVQLSLTETSLTAASQPSKHEAYVPSVNEIGAADLQTSEAVQRDLEQTTQALLINPKAYQMDGCDIFVSQVISPISVYNTILVTGSLTQWLDYVSRDGLPAPIEAYRKAIEEVLRAEWADIWELLDGKKEKGRGSRVGKRVQDKS